MKVFTRRRADIPALAWIDCASDAPRATLDGKRRALIENHRGIIEYTDERLRLACGGGEIVVTGSGICLSQVRRDSLIVTGRIDGVSMPRGGTDDG